MGKVSKHMKHKGIFLVDLKKALDEEKSAKWLDNEKHECEWGGGEQLNNGWKSTDCADGDGRVTLINLCEFLHGGISLISPLIYI